MIAVILLLISVNIYITMENLFVNDTCPTLCICNEDQLSATCGPTNKRKERLTYIPRLPGYVSTLKFVGNDVYHIYKETLVNLTFLSINTLILQSSKIKKIEPNAFQDLPKLSHLEINQNPVSLENISNSLQSLNKSIIEIFGLRFNFWDYLPNSMFQHLKGSKLKELYLDGNKLGSLSGEIFIGLSSMQRLSLKSNRYLSSISLQGLPSSVEFLDLTDNNFARIPEFCMHNSTTLPALKYLKLDKNNIAEITSSALRCLRNLTRLSLFRNRISILKRNTFHYLESLKILSINEQRDFIRKIEDFAFSSATLSKLSFTNNNYNFKKYKPKGIFQSCPNLRFLDLSKNILELSYSDIREMFLPLKNLEILILVSVQMRGIPTDLFPHLHCLKKVILSGNSISGWNDDPRMFGNLTSIEELILDGNNIKLINKTSFPAPVLSNMKRLDLQANEFTCTCELMWFRNWIEKDKGKVLSNWPQGYKCTSPPKMNGKTLKSYKPTEESCRQPNHLVTILIVSFVICGSVIAVLSILYKARWHIRYWIYLLRTKHRGYNSINGDTLNYIYDGFVVYCDNDREWVHGILVPKLEKEYGYHLCVHYRDFDVGKLIVDNIVESMEQSRTILVVLSNALARSDWCQFELRLSTDRFLKENQGILVLIMLEEINHRNMSSTLKTLITTTTYAIWTCDSTGQSQFWEQVTCSLKN